MGRSNCPTKAQITLGKIGPFIKIPKLNGWGSLTSTEPILNNPTIPLIHQPTKNQHCPSKRILDTEYFTNSKRTKISEVQNLVLDTSETSVLNPCCSLAFDQNESYDVSMLSNSPPQEKRNFFTVKRTASSSPYVHRTNRSAVTITEITEESNSTTHSLPYTSQITTNADNICGNQPMNSSEPVGTPNLTIETKHFTSAIKSLKFKDPKGSEE